MKIILLGAPGSGKGTCSNKLVDKLGLPYLSTGDEFRRLKKEGHSLGIQAYEEYKDGGLVSDNIVNEMVRVILRDDRFTDSYILDGYPRTIPQAKVFEEFGGVDYAVNFDLPLNDARERILSRLVCGNVKCGRSYSSSFKPLKPKQPGFCDYEGHGPLIRRGDDQPEKVENRFRTFLVETFPLVQFYHKKGVLRTVDGRFHPDKRVDEIYNILTSGKKSDGGLLVQ